MKRTLQMSRVPKKSGKVFRKWWLITVFFCALPWQFIWMLYSIANLFSIFVHFLRVFFSLSMCFSCVWIFYGVRVGLYFCVFILRFVEKLAAIIVCVFWSLSLLLDIRGIGHLNVVFPSKALLCGGTLSISATIAIATVSATATAVADTQWK